MPLAEYRRKRHFKKTPEPRGKTPRRRRTGLSFVVQKHAASRLHYDFRLELDGVLKSWAVPKGPSFDPAEKRLAVEVEDHPLEYGKFEGLIPEGEYGGGAVLLWDRGTWKPAGDAAASLRQGKLKFTLAGEKLQGAWALVRMARRSGDTKNNWLLFKERDEFARPASQGEVTELKPDSVASGHTIEQIASSSRRVWNGSESTTKSARKKTKLAKPSARRATRDKSTAARSSRANAVADEVAGVRLTHPDRVLYPGTRITKLALANFYVAIADWILPHLRDRPLSLVRCPQGQGKHCFYQKHPGQSAPDTLETVDIPEKEGPEPYAVVNDIAGLVSLVQIGVLEIHPWGSRTDMLERPDRVIFDLDPAPDVPWRKVIAAAQALRSLLEDELQLQTFVKTTGGKGLHVVVPILRRQEWPAVKQFAEQVVLAFAAASPSEFTTNMSKAQRKGRIFLDYLRNDRGATAVAPYSTRANGGAPVSVPLDWDELTPKLRSDYFTVLNLPKRLAALKHDPWADFFTTRQGLSTKIIGKLGGRG